jgi:hypothetical protein
MVVFFNIVFRMSFVLYSVAVSHWLEKVFLHFFVIFYFPFALRLRSGIGSHGLIEYLRLRSGFRL